MGTRALGMGGAFVAVADDATATYWNPAGLALGPVFDFIFERQVTEALLDGKNRPVGPQTRGMKGSSTALAVTTLPFGVSYYHLRTTTMPAGPAALSPADRQNVRSGQQVMSTLVTQHLGATLVQSLTKNIVVGTTLKIVRGTAGQASISGGTTEDALDRAEDIEGVTDTTGDLDAGVMAAFGPWRVGLTGRNLREPEFPVLAPDGTLAPPIRLERQGRVGFAFAPRARQSGTNGPMTVAADVDLGEIQTVYGPRREAAVGGEKWWWGGKAALRAGFRLNTLKRDGQERDPVITAGFTVAVKAGSVIEGQISRGPNGLEQGWGVNGRVTF